MNQISPHPARRIEIPAPLGPLAGLLADASPGTPLRRPAVLVPGFTGSKEDFAPILGAVAEAGHAVLAIDLRGQHESPGPDDPAVYTIGALAAEVIAAGELLVRLAQRPTAGQRLGGHDSRVHVLGHSFGGLVARAAVIAAPSRFASLTMLSSGPAAIGGPRAEMLNLMEPLLDRAGVAGLYDVVEQLSALDPRSMSLPAELREFLRTRFLNQSATGLRVMGRQLLSETDRTDELRDAGVPVLVSYGDGDDAWAPRQQAEMARRLGARTAVISEALHSPAVDRPAATAKALLGFWGGVDLAGAPDW